MVKWQGITVNGQQVLKFESASIGQECSQISGDTAQVVMSVSRVERRQKDLIIRYSKIKLVSRCKE
jgi:hypothetical protein